LAFNLVKFKAALGKKRMKRVACILDKDYQIIEVTLDNDNFMRWNHIRASHTEIVSLAKRFIDKNCPG